MTDNGRNHTGRDAVAWMFINAALGILGIYSQIGWILGLSGRNAGDYPWYVHAIPVLYFVLYTFLLRQIVLDLGQRTSRELGDRVRLVGRVPRVAMPALLRSSDVVVCAGVDGAVTPLEAMACGVPVVAATVGGATDTVVDGVTGLLVPPDDPRTLARVLRPLLADEARRDAYGIAAADRVEARYSTTRIATETVRVYLQATGLPEAVEACRFTSSSTDPRASRSFTCFDTVGSSDASSRGRRRSEPSAKVSRTGHTPREVPMSTERSSARGRERTPERWSRETKASS